MNLSDSKRGHIEVVNTGTSAQHPTEDPSFIIDFPVEEVKRLSGLDVKPHEAKAILSRLGFWVSGNPPAYRVAVPTWRPDVHGPADLVEEVIRIVGVDNVPASAFAPPRRVAPGHDGWAKAHLPRAACAGGAWSCGGRHVVVHPEK